MRKNWKRKVIFGFGILAVAGLLYLGYHYIYFRLNYTATPGTAVADKEELHELVSEQGLILPGQSIGNSPVDYWTVYRETRDRNSPVVGYSISFTPGESKLDSVHGTTFMPESFPLEEVYKIHHIPILVSPKKREGVLGVVLGKNYYSVHFLGRDDSYAKEVLEDMILQFNSQ